MAAIDRKDLKENISEESYAAGVISNGFPIAIEVNFVAVSRGQSG